MRSLATREAGSEISQALPDVIAACKVAGFDIVIVETSGIGQGDAAIVPHVDSVDVRHDAGIRRRVPAGKNRHARFRRFHRDQQVRPQGRPGRAARCGQAVPAQQANCGVGDRRTRCRSTARRRRASTTTASPPCTTACCRPGRNSACGSERRSWPQPEHKYSSGKHVIVPPARARYLAEIADTVRGYHRNVDKQVKLARERQQLSATQRMLAAAGKSPRSSSTT